MEWIKIAIDFVLHLDKYLDLIIRATGAWTYAILFVTIFIETGLVVTPFLPGDSLLFATGAFAAKGSINIYIMWILLMSAAVLGDTVNYWIGHYLGPKVFEKETKLIKREYLIQTQEFYEKHGGITIFLARFIPIIRTFAPFVAGVGKMRYSYFITYNFVGGIVWVTLFLWAGYFFGGLKIVEENFSLVVIAIILISVIPAVTEWWKARRKAKAAAKNNIDSIAKAETTGE